MNKSLHKFDYWNLIRKGITQSEVARQKNVSRQAVNKALKSYERDVLDQLLKFAQSLGLLVEWYSATTGILVGISPQLDNLLVLLVIDDHADMNVFYNQDQWKSKEKKMRDAVFIINKSLGLEISANATFIEIVNQIKRGHKV